MYYKLIRTIMWKIIAIIFPLEIICFLLCYFLVDRSFSIFFPIITMVLFQVLIIFNTSYILPRFILNYTTASLTEMINKLDVIKYPDDSNIFLDTDVEELIPIINTIFDTRQSLKSYISQLEEAEQIRRDFTANVSHELKTPLTTIKGFGEMLEQRLICDDDDVQKYGRIIFRESTRLLSLIDDIIQLAEIEDKDTNQFETINIIPLVKDCVEVLTEKAMMNNITLQLKTDETIKIPCNSMHITELLINIIDNAIKYNKSGGHVWINVFKDDNNAVISVKDDGIGIKEQYQKRVFERFYRVDKSHSRSIGGTGLGLSIVKHIVLSHNGNIQLFSKPGKGTELIVRLPKKIRTQTEESVLSTYR